MPQIFQGPVRSGTDRCTAYQHGVLDPIASLPNGHASSVAFRAEELHVPSVVRWMVDCEARILQDVAQPDPGPFRVADRADAPLEPVR
jgi:hypothetical protein